MHVVSEALAKFDSVWNTLEDFDKHCVVIDPMKPTFQHNYRRLYLGMQIIAAMTQRESVLSGLHGEL